jgi:hypothetical protein
VSAVIFELDAASDQLDFRRQCDVYCVLLVSRLSAQGVLDLIPVVRAQSRWAEVLKKYVNGVISRPSYLAFVGSQNVSPQLAARLAGAHKEDLAAIVRGLESQMGMGFEQLPGLLRLE